MKHGFIINEKFYHNKGLGHEHNARYLIKKFGWEKQWNCKGEAQDFLVLKKGAIQIGSGIFANKIIASKNAFRTIAELETKIKDFGLYGYEIVLIDW